MKFYKYLLAAAAISAGSMLTGCSDDDNNGPMVVAPDQFAIELTSVNLPWNEVEAAINFEAPQAWKAVSSSHWITVETTSGEFGECRLFVTLDPNTFLLPRTGSVTLECGDDYGVINITQGGCSNADALAPISTTLEIPALDYNAEEISFLNYEEYITNNLGITMAQFGAGLDDGGDIEMFIVAKDGSWINANTGGTPCSAWLDGDLNVTNWDGSGYPGIAVCIETYPGDEPSVAVIRAPGLPENQKYNLKWGYTLKSDHSKYVIVNCTATFPAVSYTGPIVKTFDYTVELNPEAADYEPTPLEIDADAICAALGASSLANAVVAAYDEEGEWVGYTANNGYWLTSKGAITGWGNDSAWFIEYYGNDSEDPEDEYTLYVGTFPGTENLNSTFPFCFWYNGNVVQLNITALLGDAEAEGPSEPSEPAVTYNIVGTQTVAVNVNFDVEDGNTTVEINADAIASQLGLTSLTEATMTYLYSTTERASKYTANTQGYWFDLSGAPCNWGVGTFCYYTEWYGFDAEDVAEYPEDVYTLYCGGNPENLVSGSYVFHVDFVNADNDAVRVNMLVTVE